MMPRATGWFARAAAARAWNRFFINVARNVTESYPTVEPVSEPNVKRPFSKRERPLLFTSGVCYATDTSL